MVLFDMDIQQEAIGHILWPKNHSNNYSTLFLNDCVLVHQMRGDEEYWTPGLVMGLPGAFALPSNTYMIQAHDPMSKHVRIK